MCWDSSVEAGPVKQEEGILRHLGRCMEEEGAGSPAEEGE